MRKMVIAAKAKRAEYNSMTEEQRAAIDAKFPPVEVEMEDGKVITFRMADPSDLTIMLGALQEVGVHTADGKTVARDNAAAIEAGVSLTAFLRRMLSEEDHRYLMRRVRSYSDPLTMDDVMAELVGIMQEEWTDRPSEPSSPSSSSRTRTGKRSTATSRSAASTPSTSDSTDS